jgi:acetoin utilization protein AcuB
MIAEELINHMLPPLKLSDEASKAIAWMEEFRCGQLPVVDNEKFLGFISEQAILEQNDLTKSVQEFEFIGDDCMVSIDSHFYDVLKIAGDHKLQMVAVRNDIGQYVGVITVADIMVSFAQTAAVQMPGSILVLSMDLLDYSLAEIARLVEENNAKILSSTMAEDPLDKGKIKLTIKLNQDDLTRIAATLERFGYRIIARYQNTHTGDDNKDRLDMLLRYLNI